MMLPVLPTISTSFIVLSAILVAIGWYFIRTKNRQAHERTMVLAAIAAVLFFLIYVSRTIFVGNTSFGGPEHLKLPYQIFLFSHIILAVVAAVLGLMTLYRAWKKQFEKHRKLGPTTAVTWFVTAITGVTVYVLLYVMYPGGKTVSVIEKLFGW
jgi:putative membrane protein